MNKTLLEKKGIKALTRNGTSDKFVLHEVMSGAYRKLNIKPNDTVMDIGLNIGIFTCYALQKGAKKIFSYEADKENFKLAEYNIKLNNFTSKSEIHNLAVIGNDDDYRYFFLNMKKNKGAHSLLGKRGRQRTTVKCINVNKILQEVCPDIVKMDIEGGEYELIKAIKSFNGIRELILEFHHAHLNDIKTHKKHFELLSILRKEFKVVDAREQTKLAWVTLIYCRNPN